ncbi:translation initiation factor eIF4e [Viridothelium virens]|uniref:Translation initiation factor eIF4e n=1 Tax=Viridothelium virens TaxID=1048519 RepID=A0A6A6HMQ3_VIRVR|nr:translation initiation factor eIF4e [Viridothelium virens]
MAHAPKLTTSNLPTLSEDAASATSSPARGKEMRQNLLGKLRPPPLVHSWEFYHDRQDRKKPSQEESASASSQAQPNYEDRLVKLNDITDVRDFWETFNNFDTTRLPLRDSVHLFHKGVKPVWEDKRNVHGGSWTFRVPKAQGAEFWKEICMMAIGEKLQAAVESNRKTFVDDICGISLSVRFTSVLVQIWNRDGNHKAAIDRLLETVIEELPEQLTPKEGTYYYKKHDEHAGYQKPEGVPAKPTIIEETNTVPKADDGAKAHE